MAKVLLGVSGGIAAYKAPELVRELKRHGHAGIPGRLGMVPAEMSCELRQAGVSDHREVRRGVAAVDRGQLRTLEHHDRAARGGEQVRGGQAGDAAADDGDVGALVAVELGERGYDRGIGPERRRVELDGHGRRAPPRRQD